MNAPAAGITTSNHDALIATLDLATKVRLLTGSGTFTMAGEPSIGLHEINLSDGPTGVRGLTFTGGRTVSLFPNATLLASAWDADTAYEVGRLLAEEAMVQDIRVVLGPTINLHRTALGGRLFEAYSEDPLLTGTLAAAYVRGLQDSGIGACLKHLVANESETARNTMNSVVDETTLRELYLLPFEIAIDESDPWSIMAAYNDVNGVAATEHDEIVNGVVKGEWGYTGLVMSDWFATKTAGPAANGGLDLVMPGPAGPWGDALVAAVESGEVDEAVIDDHLRRILVLAERVGALGELKPLRTDVPAPAGAERAEQLTRLAAAGMTVLTNSDDVLPLRPGVRIALIGRHALETIDMGGGSAQVNPPHQVSVAEGFAALTGGRGPVGEVTVIDGVEVRNRPVTARPGFVTDPRTGEPGVRAVIYAHDGTLLEDKHLPTAFALVGFDDNYPAPVGRVVLRARLAEGGPTEVGVVGKGDWVLRAGHTALEFAVRSATAGFGDEMLAPPSRTALVDVPADTMLEADLTLVPGEGPMANVATAGLIARRAPGDQDAVIADAAAAAADAEIAVVVVGLTEEQETEAVDKQSLRLSGRQDDLVRAVAAAAPRTVVVVNAATPVLMPWLDEVDAVLWAGLPGQEGGHAIAAALTGAIEPAGRLVTTFPVADGAAPAWDVAPVDGDVVYTEGTAIGYRGHDSGLAPAPAFWLGHGLGYATWEYESAEPGAPRDGVPAVTVTVRNTGARRSREIVQVYFRPAEPDQPVRLVGWAAVTVDPGERGTVTVRPDLRLWRRWDAAGHRWDRLGGGGRLLVARGLGDVRATVELG